MFEGTVLLVCWCRMCLITVS